MSGIDWETNMGKPTTEAADARWIGTGRGQGTQAAYVSWYRVQDAQATGTSWRIDGWTTGRHHELLNSLQADVFYSLDWRADIVDIREHYPLLPVSDTVEVARRLGIRHPRHAADGQPAVLVTTFIVITSDGALHARHVTYSASALKPQVSRRLEIERVYCECLGIEWRLITECDVPYTLVANVRRVHKYRNLSERVQIDAPTLAATAALMERETRDDYAPLREAARAADVEFGLRAGTGLAIAYHLIATRVWHVDMNVPLDPLRPLQFAALSGGGVIDSGTL